MTYIIPFMIVLLILYCIIKKVNVYKTFIDGASKSIELVFSIFAYITAVFILIELFKISGLSSLLAKFFSPVFSLLGIPSELIELIIFKPFSGSGTLAILTDIYSEYGVNSYISRCASVIVGSSETVFYVSGVYFSKTSVKKLGYALPLALLCTLFSSVLACLLCKIM